MVHLLYAFLIGFIACIIAGFVTDERKAVVVGILVGLIFFLVGGNL